MGNLPSPTVAIDSTDETRPQFLFPIVGVGASAGGLEAFSQFLHHLPIDTGFAFVLVQHLDPKHDSILTELLAKVTKMKIEEARNGTKIRPNFVYVIPPAQDITIEHGALALQPRKITSQGSHMPIDLFFRSIADIQGSKAIGVVLSGNGADGTLGIEAIHSKGGITMAQDPKTAKFDGMPRSAIATGLVNIVLSPEGIAQELKRISRHPIVNGHSRSTEKPEEPLYEKNEDLGKLFGLLRIKTGVDFNHYKRSTIDRRIARRMILQKIENLSDYVDHLKQNPAEVVALYQDILIKVTRFFRDPKTFDILVKKVFGEMMRKKPRGASIRLWVPGCSTGEEVYTLAICLLEFLGDKASDAPIQIFGSDISEVALEKARTGTYFENISADVSSERLRRFFTKVDGHYQVNKTIRELCVFAKQNVLRDPPFSKLDLISCRNVLIYMDPVLQKKVFPIFHFSLNPNGWLLLGSSESVGSFSDLFSVVDHKHRIYVKNISAQPRLTFDFGSGVHGGAVFDKSPTPIASAELLPGRNNLSREVDRALVNRYAPVGVVVNENLEIIQFRGDTSPYFQIPSGEPSIKLIKMIREELQPEVDAALKEAKKKNALSRKTGLPFEWSGKVKSLSLEVFPITLPLSAERYWGIMFQEENLSSPQSTKTLRLSERKISKLDEETNRWKKELVSTRAYLESVIEDKESAMEELQSANEEVLSSNEELQSINEEMQTAKEELQSTNEELTTINEELHKSNLQSLLLADDLNNLLDSVRIPVVMVGSDLKIRRFTAPAEKLLHLIPGDVGRSISDVNIRVKILDLEKILLEVIDNVVIKEQQVQSGEGHWYSIRIHPYKTQDKKIDGAVIIFIDVESMKRTEIAIAKARDAAEDILGTVREPLVVLDSHLRVKHASPSFYQGFLTTPTETEGCYLYELGDGAWNIPKLRSMLNDVILKNNSFRDFEVAHEFPDIGNKFMVLNASKVSHRQGEEQILLAIEDITERRRAEETLRRSEQRFRHLVEEAQDYAIYIMNTGGRITTWNIGAERLKGYTTDEIVGRHFRIFFTKEDQKNNLPEQQLKIALEQGRFSGEGSQVRKDKSVFWCSYVIAALKDREGKVFGFSKITRDISDRKRAELELAKKAQDLHEANQRLNNFNKELEIQVLQRTENLEERNKELKQEIAEREWAETNLNKSEQNYTHLVQGLKDYAVFLLNPEGNILVWNQGAERITGYQTSEVLGTPATHLFMDRRHEFGTSETFNLMKSLETGISQWEGWAYRKDGQRFWSETTLDKLMDENGKLTGVSVIVRDTTHRKSAEDKIKASLQEKEIMLKEIHHRVKNNLQIISSLLRLQSELIKDKETAALLLDSQERVRAMAMVHEYLYNSVDLSRINFPAYVASLVRNLCRAFAVASSKFRPHIVVEDVGLSLDLAVPCGLLLTELVSNALKYAYPDKEGGAIDILFRKQSDGSFELTVADQGRGFEKSFDWENSHTLGLRLIRLLTEQLNGKISLETDHGVKFVVTFKDLVI